MLLSEKLIELCRKTKTSQEGLEKLVEYYMRSLGWTREQANEYALGLFKDGTIDEIKVINGKDASI